MVGGPLPSWSSPKGAPQLNNTPHQPRQRPAPSGPSAPHSPGACRWPPLRCDADHHGHGRTAVSMGGNGWLRTGAYQQDLAAAFRQAQEEELAKDDHGFTGMTMEELWADESWQEYILTGGT